VKPVVLFGVGDFARVAHVYLRDDSPREVAAFTVHGEYADGDSFRGLPLVPFEELEGRYPPDAYAMFVAIGFSGVNRVRAGIYDECKGRGYELVSFVSSRAFVSEETAIGDNCFVFEANVVQPFVTIGDDVVLWSGNHIGHDVTIEDHVFIASHVVISGHARIGARSFVGVNATFRDGVTVAPDCVIGAGAAIMKDTVAGGVYPGPRAEAIEKKSWELAF
jgi:sugar O-acyltransferase (sialic acid O-acetyltransferase NeuD family)